MAIVYIKRNDTARVLQDQLLLADAPIDLTGATVSICFSLIGGTSTFKRAATVADAGDGQVRYQLTPTDTAVAGDYRIEWEIVFPNSSILTVPDNGWHILKILEDLG